MIVGLTGGIGSGKSAAANFFQNEGITVIDADDLSREVIEQDTPGFEKIVELLWAPQLLILMAQLIEHF